MSVEAASVFDDFNLLTDWIIKQLTQNKQKLSKKKDRVFEN